jgi:hypothetical protein
MTLTEKETRFLKCALDLRNLAPNGWMQPRNRELALKLYIDGLLYPNPDNPRQFRITERGEAVYHLNKDQLDV